MCEYINAICKKCKDAGLRFGYHNHSKEFLKVEGTTMLDELLAKTDPENVFFEMDVYWAVMAGVSPVEYMKKYPGRFPMLHIKDKYEIGQSGMVGFEPIFRNMKTAGTESFTCIEVEDRSFESSREKVLDSLRLSKRYMEQFVI